MDDNTCNNWNCGYMYTRKLYKLLKKKIYLDENSMRMIGKAYLIKYL